MDLEFNFLLWASVILLINVIVGLLRFSSGAGPIDRILAIQLSSTAVVAMVLLLAAYLQSTTMIDVALLLALLAPVAVVTFVRRGLAHNDPVQTQGVDDGDRH